jgi:hypothetical protein
MTDKEKKLEVINTIQWLLNEGDFENWETAYNCGMNSINMLNESLSLSSNVKSKDKEAHTFEVNLNSKQAQKERCNLVKKTLTATSKVYLFDGTNYIEI